VIFFFRPIKIRFQTNQKGKFSFQTLVFFFSDYNMNQHCRIANEIVMSDNRVEEIVEEMDIDEDSAFRHVSKKIYIYICSSRNKFSLAKGAR
jgi:hypothetical protein